MIQFNRCFTFLLLLLFVAACSKPAPTPTAATPTPQKITSEGVVTATIGSVEISDDDSHEVNVTITVEPGYHINANPASFPYLKATTLDVPPIDGVSVDSITYPKALQKKFAFAEGPLAVYEGTVEIKVKLKTAKNQPSKERSLPATLRIQACDDQVCYPPGKLQLSILILKR